MTKRDEAPLAPLHALLDAVGRVVQEARHHKLPGALEKKIAEMEHASGPRAVRAVNGERALREALRDLLAAWDRCEPRIMAVTRMSAIHGSPYDASGGATIHEELKAARAALAASEEP